MKVGRYKSEWDPWGSLYFPDEAKEQNRKDKTMNLEDYQREVKRTTGTTNYTDSLVMASMGLAGETGEVIDILKKYLWHSHELDRDKIIKELGDVMWYLSALCNTLDISLDEVIAKNVEKLRKRYPDGFDSKRSIEREDEV